MSANPPGYTSLIAMNRFITLSTALALMLLAGAPAFPQGGKGRVYAKKPLSFWLKQRRSADNPDDRGNAAIVVRDMASSHSPAEMKPAIAALTEALKDKAP